MLGVRVPPGLPNLFFWQSGVSGVKEMNEFLQKLKSSFMSGVEFLKDTRKELNNVSWPSRRELTGTTLVVIVAVFFFGFFLWVVDSIVNTGMIYIFHRGQS
jgi:preprotein translocase SecE subunit